MHTWTDSFLEHFSAWSQIIGLCLLLLTLAAGYAVYATQKELTRRARENERSAKAAEESKTKTLIETEGRLAQAQKAADDASAQVKQLEEKQRQRVITAAQKAAFITATAHTPKGPIAVEILLGGPECLAYADQIREMVAAAGFESGAKVGQGLAGPPSAQGIIMWARDGSKLPPFTGDVLNALVAIGLDLQTHADPNNQHIPEKGLLITVGTKP